MRPGNATLAASALLLTANLATAAGTTGAEAAAEYSYRTQAHDTLIGLSRRLLKDPRRWTALQKRNAIANPTRVPVGTAILIPRDWLRDAPETAVVTTVVGAVTGDGVRLKAGDLLKEGEAIGTAAGAYVTITLADGSLASLSAAGSLVLERLRRYVGTGRRDMQLKLNDGSLDLRVKPQGEAGRFQIRTPVALSAVRGTEFRRTAGLDKTEVIDGTVSVSGVAGGVLVPAGFGTISDEKTGPRAPVKLLEPPDLSALPPAFEDDEVRVEFAPVAGAVGYHAQVARDESFQSVVAETTSQAAVLDFAGLADARYFMRIRSRDGQGLEGADAVRSFERHQRLAAPQPGEPRADAYVTGDGAVFAWAAVAGAASYHLQLASDPEFTRMVADQDHIAPTELALSQVPPGTYYWRLAGADAAGNAGKWSPAQRYRQKRAPVMLPAPVLNAKSFEISWAGEQGQHYELQIARDTDFRHVVEEQQLATSHATLHPLGAGAYYARVRAADDDGYQGPYSPPRRFVAPLPWWAKFAPVLLAIPFL